MLVEIRTKNGEVQTNLGSAELIEINGEPCMFAVAADITDLKRAEKIRLRHAAIHEATWANRSDARLSKVPLVGVVVAGAER
jgi:hypothetical protein